MGGSFGKARAVRCGRSRRELLVLCSGSEEGRSPCGKGNIGGRAIVLPSVVRSEKRVKAPGVKKSGAEYEMRLTVIIIVNRRREFCPPD